MIIVSSPTISTQILNTGFKLYGESFTAIFSFKCQAKRVLRSILHAAKKVNFQIHIRMMCRERPTDVDS